VSWIKSVDRRVFLGERMPTCPGCGEQHQVQLIEYLGDPPAGWRCRTCRLKFYHEPSIEEPAHAPPGRGPSTLVGER
jgi:tRNA(Ile2) C34 agmatinyltransferase TiaS